MGPSSRPLSFKWKTGVTQPPAQSHQNHLYENPGFIDQQISLPPIAIDKDRWEILNSRLSREVSHWTKEFSGINFVSFPELKECSQNVQKAKDEVQRLLTLLEVTSGTLERQGWLSVLDLT